MDATSTAAIVVAIIAVVLVAWTIMLIFSIRFWNPEKKTRTWYGEITKECKECIADPCAINRYSIIISGPIAWAMFAYYTHQERSGHAQEKRDQDRLRHPEHYAGGHQFPAL